MSPPSCEVADVFRRYGRSFRSRHKLTKKQHEAVWAITHCRTERLGVHVDRCDHCGHLEEAYNSCRNRHCPKCQGIARHKWIHSRLEQVLPVPYYHVVFTLPHLLIPLAGHNRRLIFNLLFDCAARTLLAFGRDPAWLGGELGFYGVLHTWGQTLWPHPHVHFIVPGGALANDGTWIPAPHRNRFLFPVRALSKVFRGKFVAGLKKAYYGGELALPAEDLAEAGAFEGWVDQLVARPWVVYCKSPVNKPAQAILYIGRYTHRVAISNHRLIRIEKGQVHFQYKNYRKHRLRWQEMTLDTAEFMRRFLWHVLPTGFHKIRHYGFLANGRSRQKIADIKRLLSYENCDTEKGNSKNDSRVTCPRCRKGVLLPFIRILRHRGMFLSKRIRGQCLFDTS